jgi:hypothetical protein
VAIGYLLLADSRNWRTATNMFRYELIGFLLSVICSGRPIDLHKPHIFAQASKTSFLQFKGRVPFKIKKKISGVQCKRKSFQYDITFDPC